MPDIVTPFKLTPTQSKLVADTVAAGKVDWSSSSLASLRSAIRTHYRREQKNLCAFCRKEVSLRSALNAQVEHVLPKTLYPQFMFEPANLCVVCADCNEIKRNQETANEVPDPLRNGGKRRYPRASSSFKIVQPHYECFDEHIVIFHLYYVEKTAKGHFTIGACELNRHMRRFGWTAPIYDDSDVAEAMTRYLDAKSFMEQSAAMDKLRRLLALSR